jgi:hypothetical protein
MRTCFAQEASGCVNALREWITATVVVEALIEIGATCFAFATVPWWTYRTQKAAINICTLCQWITPTIVSCAFIFVSAALLSTHITIRTLIRYGALKATRKIETLQPFGAQLCFEAFINI